MTAPANTKPLAFIDRLPLVKREVSKRLSSTKPQQRDAVKARLWCQWLIKEVSA